MACYESSIEALKQLLYLGTYDRKASDKNTNVTHCHITKASKDVADGKNGTEYYSVEVTCSNGTQYGLQAYGEEAIELYYEAHRIRCLHRTNNRKLTAAYEVPIGHGAKCIAANIMAAD